MSSSVAITLHVNGEEVEALVKPRQHLADFLRENLGLTGTHLGCEQGVCGACSVLAVQADGARVDTVEGLSDSGELAALQRAFENRNALQCGYCTPGMLLNASELLKRNAQPTREEIREHLSGNYCRCTGYHAIVDAVETASRAGDAS